MWCDESRLEFRLFLISFAQEVYETAFERPPAENIIYNMLNHITTTHYIK